MVYCFLFLFAKKTSICKNYPSSLKLVKSEHLTPRRFPCKKTYLGGTIGFQMEREGKAIVGGGVGGGGRGNELAFYT